LVIASVELIVILFPQMKRQMEVFKTQLSKFAQEHRAEINDNPVFRHQFQQMCVSIGVDPLASSKGFWTELLGIGDFYYELSVQIVEICMATRKTNGGLLRLSELLSRLKQRRGISAQSISEYAYLRQVYLDQFLIQLFYRYHRDDVRVAIEKIACLGNGYRIIDIGSLQGSREKEKFLVSVPIELSTDHSHVLEAAKVLYIASFNIISSSTYEMGFYCCQGTAFVCKSGLVSSLRWTGERVDSVLQYLQQQGLVWIDNQTDTGEPQYWFPSLFVASVRVVSNSSAKQSEHSERDAELESLFAELAVEH
jgi:ESCRT-II complex subunit VPS22